jgi:hypothetical protein
LIDFLDLSVPASGRMTVEPFVTDLLHEIDAALHSDKPIRRDDVLRWIAVADDISVLSRLYRLTGERYYSITPELGRDETCSLIRHYLLECIRLNVTGRDDVQDRWQAAQTLHVWFCHLMEQDGAALILKQAAQAITEVFLAGDNDIRNAVEAGFLEHALETPALHRYFEHWSTDNRLRPAWSRAMEWGNAHPDFTWGMLKRLKEIRS